MVSVVLSLSHACFLYSREIPCELFTTISLAFRHKVLSLVPNADIPEGSKVKYFYKASPSTKGKYEIMSEAQKREIEQKNLTCSMFIHFTPRVL